MSTITIWCCQSDASHEDRDSPVLSASLADFRWYGELARRAEEPR